MIRFAMLSALLLFAGPALADGEHTHSDIADLMSRLDAAELRAIAADGRITGLDMIVQDLLARTLALEAANETEPPDPAPTASLLDGPLGDHVPAPGHIAIVPGTSLATGFFIGRAELVEEYGQEVADAMCAEYLCAGVSDMIEAYTGWGFEEPGADGVSRGTKIYLPPGGGHSSTGLNPTGMIDLEALTAEILLMPSPLGTEVLFQYPMREDGPDGQSQPVLDAEGNPVLRDCLAPEFGPLAMHYYDGILDIPDNDEILFAGTTAWCAPGRVAAWVALGFAYSKSKNTYRHLSNLDKRISYPVSAYDAVSDRAYLTGPRTVLVLDPKDDWKILAEIPMVYPQGAGNAVVDPVRRKLWIVGNHGIQEFTLDDAGIPSYVRHTGNSFGFAYWHTDEEHNSRIGRWGLAVYPEDGSLVGWGGLSRVSRYYPETRQLKISEPICPSWEATHGIYSKWSYLGDGVFIGMGNWVEGLALYKLHDTPMTGDSTTAAFGQLECDTETDDPVIPFDLQGAIDAAPEGGTVLVPARLHKECAVIRKTIHIKGEVGPNGERARLEGVACQGKGALVVKAPNVSIEGLEISGITSSGDNGSCVRIEAEASDIVIRNLYCHDNDEGVLGGPLTGGVTIEDSIFERNGAFGQAHGLYVGRGEYLILRNSKVIDGKGLGHLVKSGAARTVIEDSVLASLDGNSSRPIDAYRGGDLIIRRTVIQQGPKTDNKDLINFGRSSQSGGIIEPPHHAIIEDSWIIIDRPDGEPIRGRLIDPDGGLVLTRTTIVGADNIGRQFVEEEADWAPLIPINTDSTFYPDRAAAGLPAYDGTEASLP